MRRRAEPYGRHGSVDHGGWRLGSSEILTAKIDLISLSP
jgi:hypothetical protein